MTTVSTLLIMLLTGFRADPNPVQDQPVQIVSGRVTNTESGEPLENVNVYLSYTSTGASTDSTGMYRLATPRVGVFDLVASRVGFGRYSRRITIRPGDSLVLDVALAPALLETQPVDITSTPDRKWEKNLSTFTRAFIGHSAFSEECRILNPAVLEFDSDGDTLIARSDSTIVVENRALGYLLHITLAEFVWNTAGDYGHFLIYPYFINLRTSDADEADRWIANRETAYQGSIRHFFRSLVQQRTSEELFSISSGPLMKIIKSEGHMVSDRDFQIKPAEDLPFYMVRFPGYIRVEYGERDLELAVPGDRYSRRQAIAQLERRSRDISIVRLTGPPVLVDSAGNLFDPLAIEVSGYWGEHRIEYLLPND